MAEPILSVRDLVVEFARDGAPPLRAVDGVSFDVPRGAAVGLVGESGSGKSVTALATTRLLAPGARIAAGRVVFDGRDLTALDEESLCALRGDRIGFVFQEPLTALNPVFTTGDQVGEVLRVHKRVSRREARAAAVDLFRLVGIADPERRVGEYPHQMSGGMRQRVMIAMALACRPSLVIADEPTTALDVTIQAQILDLLGKLRRELGMSLVLITHDLGIVAETCDEVVVMYAGQVVERAAATAIFAGPRHPYTAGLLRALPRLDEDKARLVEIPGMVPRLDELPSGCRFRDRCDRAQDRCAREAPELVPVDEQRLVRCHFPVADVEAAA